MLYFSAEILIENLNQSPKICQTLKKLSQPLKITAKVWGSKRISFSMHKTLALEQGAETYRAWSCKKPCFGKGKYSLSSSWRSITLINGFYLSSLLVLSPSYFSFLLLHNQFYFNLEICLDYSSNIKKQYRSLLLSRHLFLASNAEN